MFAFFEKKTNYRHQDKFAFCYLKWCTLRKYLKYEIPSLFVLKTKFDNKDKLFSVQLSIGKQAISGKGGN